MVLRSLTFLLFIMVIVLGCSKTSEETIPGENNIAKIPVQEGWNSKLILSKAGQRQAEVDYGHMAKYEGEKVIHFDEGVEVNFYNREGSHTSYLTADRGEYHEDSEDVFGMGNVVVISDSGVTLQTEVLRWDNRREKIISDTTVIVITENGDTLWGVGFESNADLTRRVIRKARGVSQEKIDFEALEKSFSEVEEKETIPVVQDSMIQKNGT